MPYTERTPAASPVKLFLSPFFSDKDFPQALHKHAMVPVAIATRTTRTYLYTRVFRPRDAIK